MPLVEEVIEQLETLPQELQWRGWSSGAPWRSLLPEVSLAADSCALLVRYLRMT